MGRPRSLSDDLVRELRASTEPLRALSARTGVSVSMASRVRTGRLYADVPDVAPDGSSVPYDAQRATANRRRATRLTDERVDLIRTLIALGWTSARIGAQLDVHPSVVGKIRAGITYRFAGYQTRAPARNRPRSSTVVGGAQWDHSPGTE